MRTAIFLMSGCAAAAMAATAQAQTTASQPMARTPAVETATDQNVGVQDIVVTAQRRSERLQDVPVAVTATTAARIAALGVTNTQDLSIVTPGLVAQTAAGYSQPFIRGVGSTAVGAGVERPVATYIDGVYIAAAPAALITLNNIERVEVLKGPQGTLFGRNSTGGLIQVITRDPGSVPTANLNLTYGSYQTLIADAYVSGPLSQDLSADIAARYEHQGKGWGRNLFTGNDTGDLDHDFAGRIKIVFKPTSLTRIALTADYESRNSRRETQYLDPQLPRPLNTPFLGGPYLEGRGYDINYDIDPTIASESGGVALDISQTLGSLELKSITAYRELTFHSFLDFDQLPVRALEGDISQRSKQFSQELQLSSGSVSRLKYVAGLYYFLSDDAHDPLIISFGPTRFSPVAPFVPASSRVDAAQKTNSVAGFAQASYEVLPRTNLTLGGRLTYEKKTIDGTQGFTVFGNTTTAPVPTPGLGLPDKLDFTRFNYRIALDHKITPVVLVYASYSTGFKSGGFNVGVPSNPPYKPESIKSLEGGMKSTLFDNKIRLNIAAFHYDYRDIQVNRYEAAIQVLYNGARAKLYGVDFDTELVLTRDFHLFGGFAYNHARFTSFPDADFLAPVGGCIPAPGQFCSGEAKGNALPFAPETTFNIGGQYKVDLSVGELVLNATYFRTSRYFSNPDNVAFQPSYDLVNASLEWIDPSKRLSVKIWGRNLGDTFYSNSLTESSRGLVRQLGGPRTVGATLGFKY